MRRVPSMSRLLASVILYGGLAFATHPAQALTNFQIDVTTAIDRGIEYLNTAGAFNNPSSAGDASGLPMLALLDKRASGNPNDPPQGYTGASATDQSRLRHAAAYILDRVNEVTFYAYRDGAWMSALAEYALTGGPDRDQIAIIDANPAIAGPDYLTIKQTMDMLVDRTIANQRRGNANNAENGYWCYTDSSCRDSSTTQFAAAGLAAAKAFYSDASPDRNDPVRVAQINTSLGLAKQAYELNAGTGSDNGSCNVLTATEQGHGYHSPLFEGYKPSLQQTASGIYVMMFGGANVNSPSVQHYIEWIRNRYRYTDLDNLGNSWAGNSWAYYLWSSFKGAEFIRASGVPPNAGNLTPDDYGTLPAANAPACTVRQAHKDPNTVARPASFGPGGVGFYAGETPSQYFDYATEILSHQCTAAQGNAGYFGCNSSPGNWESWSHQSYQLLVLQRAVGAACVDSDGDGVCDAVDNCPNVFNPGQEDSNHNGIGDACEVAVLKCDANNDGKVDAADLAIIRRSFGAAAGANDPRDPNGDGVINIVDLRYCQLHQTPAGAQ